MRRIALLKSITVVGLPLALIGIVLLALSHFTPAHAWPLKSSHDTEESDVLREVSASTLQTWTHTTRADWEQGTLDWLDSNTISGSLQLAQRVFGDDEPVSANAGTNQTDPVIVAHPTQANTLYAAWVDSRNGHWDIYTARSTDGGTTWSASVKVNDDTGEAAQYEPTMTIADDGTLYLAWTDERDGDADICVARSTDGGATWSTNLQANDDRNAAAQSEPSLLYGESSTLYLAWRDRRNSSYSRGGDIYFARSNDGGDTWSLSERVNDVSNYRGMHNPELARSSDGTLYLAYIFASYRYTCDTGNVHVIKSTDDGETWTASVGVNYTTPLWVMESDPDSIAFTVGTGDKLYVAWTGRACNTGDWPDLYFAYSDDGGLSWSMPAQMNSSFAVNWKPDLITGSGTVYLAWRDMLDYWTGRNLVARSVDGGVSWSSGVEVGDGYEIDAPDLTIGSDGQVYEVWTDRRYDEDVYTARSSDSGLTWSANVQVDDGPGRGHRIDPDLAIDSSGTLYLSWRDGRNGNEDIYFATRPAGGAWGANVKVNDDVGTGDQWTPAIAVYSSGNAHAVWTDERDGDRDIYSAYRAAISATWESSVKINDDAGASWQSYADIAVDGSGNANAIWWDQRNGDADIYFAYRAASSTTWGTNVKINDDTGTALQHYPTIAVDGNGNAYAVWTDERNSGGWDSGDLYFAYRAAVSATWSANVQVNDVTGAVRTSWPPALAVDDTGDAYVVWAEQNNGNMEILFAERPVGQNWSEDIRISDISGSASQYHRDIAVDSLGNLHVIWNDQSRGSRYVSRPAGSDWGTNVPIGMTAGAIVVDSTGTAYIVGNGILFAQSVTPKYQSDGTYTSPELDTGATAAAWESLAYSGTVPNGTSLTFDTRSRIDGDIWSEWEPGVSAVTSPVGRYFQYRVIFSTTLTDATPLLEQVQIGYRSVGTPSAPRFTTACGVTNQSHPTLRGSATVGSVVRLYANGNFAISTTVWSNGSFWVQPSTGPLGTLYPSTYIITASAENEQGLGPASAPLTLTVDPALDYDPINVRAGQWSKDGWLMSVPRDADGCANPDNDWRVWPRRDERFRVEVPISYTTQAAVTVTIGTAAITLTEESADLFVGVFQPPIQAGDFVIEVKADGVETVVDGGPVLIDPDGFVYEASGTISDTIPGVQVTCHYSDTHSGQWVAWDAWNYAQVNPQVTLDDGYYSFYTPPGTYRVVAEKEGYPIYTSPELAVVSTPIRHNVPLGEATRWVYLPLLLRSH